MRWIRTIIITLLALCCNASHAQSYRVITGDIQNGKVQDFIRDLQLALPDKKTPSLTIALGASGLKKALEQDDNTPIIVTMIASTSYHKIVSTLPVSRQRLISAVFADPDPIKQVALARLLLGSRAQLVTVVTSDSAPVMAPTASHNVAIHNVDGENLGQWLGNLRASALIAVPDGSIYSKEHIRTIITALYHKNIPIIGYNDAFVRAGALASIDSQPSDLIPQIVEVVANFETTRKLDVPQYPKRFRVHVNEQLARSLGIQVPKVDRLEALLAGGEW